MTNATSNAIPTETASKSIDSMTADALLYSAVEYWSIADILSNLKNCPPTIHVRGGVENIDQKIIDEKKTALTFEKKILVENPLTVYMNEGEPTVVDGNNRLRALRELHESDKALTFADVPIRYMLLEPTLTNLTRLQINANDTTTRHSVLQLAHSVNRLWDTTYAQEMSTNGGNDKSAGGKATKACIDVTQKTKAYIGDLRKIASTPEWLLVAYDHGLVSLDVILKMTQLSKTASNMTLEMIFQGCQLRLPSGTFAITLAIFKEFKAEYEKSVKAAEKVSSGDTNEPTDPSENPTAEKTAKPFDKEAAMSAIKLTLTAVFSTLEGDAIDTAADEIIYNIAKAIGKLNALILSNGFVGVDRAVAILEAQKDLMLELFQDPAMLEKVNDDELRSVFGHTQVVDKTISTFLAVKKVEASDDDEEDDSDEYELEGDEFLMENSDPENDHTDENSGYSPDYQGGEYEPNGVGDGDHDDDNDLA